MRRLLTTLVPVALWLVLFAYGSYTASSGIIGRMGEVHGAGKLWLLFQLIPAWTWTNVCFLCILSALVAELGTRPAPEPQVAAMKGFFVYLATIGGQLLFDGSLPFAVAQQQDYLRIAGVVSLVAFLTSHDPELFKRLTQKHQPTTPEPAGVANAD
jgi:hypothetical protein